jgi:type II secretory ATPase GspE/PulE/Tfp pilus assembly ATPase PilB-like protein
MTVAQRLVRKICPNCVRSYKMPPHMIDQLRAQMNVDHLWERMQELEVIANGQKIEDTTFWRGSGCSQCNNEGYKGRVGIYEVMEIGPNLAKLITGSANAGAINDQAIADGMITLLEDGFAKAIKATTTIEEILRVTKE